RSRELAAEGMAQFYNRQIDLSLLLSWEAYKAADTKEARKSLIAGLEYGPNFAGSLRGPVAPTVPEQPWQRSRWASLAFSLDGKVLASSTASGSINVWDFAGHQSLTQQLPSQGNNQFIGLTFSPNGKRLAAAAYPNTIVLWDIQTGEQREIRGARE